MLTQVGTHPRWLLLLVLPLVELLGHGLIRARVPSDDDWREAARVVRDDMEPDDLVTTAPDWADPLLRRHLGDRISLAAVGRSDTSGFGRVWAITLRGQDPPEAPDAAPELDRSVGRLRVRRWSLPAGPPVLYDFVAQVGDAQVDRVDRGTVHGCARRRTAPPRGGGLGRNVLPPVERFVCDPKRPWLWVEATIMEDRSLAPRRCIYQHAAGPEPIRVYFTEVPAGERLVVYGGIYYEDERHEQGGPVDLVVRVDGAELGRLQHRDGLGWQRMEVPLTSTGADRSIKVSFEVTAPNPHKRSFCWSARVLGQQPDDASPDARQPHAAVDGLRPPVRALGVGDGR